MMIFVPWMSTRRFPCRANAFYPRWPQWSWASHVAGWTRPYHARAWDWSSGSDHARFFEAERSPALSLSRSPHKLSRTRGTRGGTVPSPRRTCFGGLPRPISRHSNLHPLPVRKNSILPLPKGTIAWWHPTGFRTGSSSPSCTSAGLPDPFPNRRSVSWARKLRSDVVPSFLSIVDSPHEARARQPIHVGLSRDVCIEVDRIRPRRRTETLGTCAEERGLIRNESSAASGHPVKKAPRRCRRCMQRTALTRSTRNGKILCGLWIGSVRDRTLRFWDGDRGAGWV